MDTWSQAADPRRRRPGRDRRLRSEPRSPHLGSRRGGLPAHKSHHRPCLPPAADVGSGHDGSMGARTRPAPPGSAEPLVVAEEFVHAIAPAVEVRVAMRSGSPMRIISSEARRASLTVLGRGSAHRRSVTSRVIARSGSPVSVVGLHRRKGSSATAEPSDRDPAARSGQLLGAGRPRRGTDHGTTTQVAGDRDGGLVRRMAGRSGRIDLEDAGARDRRRRSRDTVIGQLVIVAPAGRGASPRRWSCSRPRAGIAPRRRPVAPSTSAPVRGRSNDVHPAAVRVTRSTNRSHSSTEGVRHGSHAEAGRRDGVDQLPTPPR